MPEIPESVLCALSLLRGAGFEAFTVGGCVRDFLMGRRPSDWDITTDALPEQTARVFASFRVVETGLRHGTLTVLLDGAPLEITTYRVDGPYSDGRHPDRVAFTRSLTEDLRRRDFTVNAMAYAPESGLLDPFGGRADLEARVIRCVGDPAARFSEDALRILRALRFSSVLGFSIERRTAEALVRDRLLLRQVSAERKTAELSKLLTGRDAGRVLADYGPVLAAVIPELAPLAGTDPSAPPPEGWRQVAAAVGAAVPELPVRLALLLYGLDPDAASGSLSALRVDRETARAVGELIGRHGRAIEPDRRKLRRLLSEMGADGLRRLLSFEEALLKAAHPADAADALRAARALLDDILQSGDCYSLPQLAVGGRELLDAGLRGPEVGRMLDLLLESVIDGACENERGALLARARALRGGRESPR